MINENGKKNPKKTQLVTKESIKRYLKLYPKLFTQIRMTELEHIKYSPSLEEWKHNINTIENQVISMEEDSKLQEMRFYKKQLDKHLTDDQIIDYLYLIITGLNSDDKECNLSINKLGYNDDSIETNINGTLVDDIFFEEEGH